VGANGAKADAEDAGDVAVSAAARHQHGDLVFARRQHAAAAANEGAAQMRLKRVEQIEIALTEFGTALRPPDAKVAEIAIAVEDEHVDAVVEAVAGEKVIVELGAYQAVPGNDIVDQRRAPPRPKLEGHRIVKLIPVIITAQIARRHVEVQRLVKPVLARVPDVGGAKIAAQEAHHVGKDDGTRVLVRTEAFKARDNVAEQAQFAARNVANHSGHSARPVAHHVLELGDLRNCLC
jgi:hypothetical protein